MNRVLLMFGTFFLISQVAIGQCNDYTAGPYNNLDIAPCEEGGSFEITGFEVYASEAYTIGAVKAGGIYEFSICNGDGVGAWVPDFSIISPNGTVDNFGAGDGDGCTITWTASESGEYLVVINEADSCGIANNIGNGYPQITTISGGNPCAEMIDGAESFEEAGEFPECWIALDADGDTFEWELLENSEEAFDGDYAMISYSWFGDPLSPDNYFITPQLQLGSDESLYYVVRAGDSQSVGDKYSVMVSTTGIDAADFTDEVFSETMTSAVWQGRLIDLSAYDGQVIYIAFRHHDVSDVFYFLIDAVKLPGTVNCSPEGINSPDVLKNISIYPNPSNGLFNVLNNGKADQYVVRVFDIAGKEVKQDKVLLNTGSQYQVDLTNYPSGVYNVQFISSDNVGSLRVVKH